MVAGADGLESDPMNGWNLRPESFSHCVAKVQRAGVPLLLLGGGGYSTPDTARAWAAATAAAVEVSRSGVYTNTLLPENVPCHDFFSLYGPTFTMSGKIADAKEIKRRDDNSSEFLEQLTARLLRYIKRARKRLAKDTARQAAPTATTKTQGRARKRAEPASGCDDVPADSKRHKTNPLVDKKIDCTELNPNHVSTSNPDSTPGSGPQDNRKLDCDPLPETESSSLTNLNDNHGLDEDYSQVSRCSLQNVFVSKTKS